MKEEFPLKTDVTIFTKFHKNYIVSTMREMLLRDIYIASPSYPRISYSHYELIIDQKCLRKKSSSALYLYRLLL